MQGLSMTPGEAAMFNALNAIVKHAGPSNRRQQMIRRRTSSSSSRMSSMKTSSSSSGIGGGVGQMANVRFNDMGERGGVTTTRYRKRKYRKISRRKRRKIKRFRKAVRKVFRRKQTTNTLQEFWTSDFQVIATTPDTFLSTMAGNRQCIWGNASVWGLNHGEEAADGNDENQYICEQIARYQPRIGGADVGITANTARDYNKFWVQRKYLKLSIRNTSPSKDLIFDLYECVAAQDIADEDYANPVIAWKTVQLALVPYRTGTIGEAYIKGTEPTDCPQFGRWWKILRKEKVRIPFASNNINAYQTFKMHSPKFFYRGDKFNKLWAKKGLTKYFMMITDPEQTSGTSRYGGTDLVFSVIGHRNTHYKTVSGQGGLNAENSAPNWIRKDLTTPSL